MRVISGSAKGRKLITLDGDEITRPTGEKVKEAIFSSIHFDLPDANVLDLFGGSGQMGIEAVSRGAKHADIIDKNRDAIAVINQNVKSTGLEKSITVKQSDALSYIENTRNTYDIAILDPPYASDLLLRILPLLVSKMNENGIIICETEAENLPENVGNFELYRKKKYSKTNVYHYR
ncbi:MAG TPA: 16S rRNA (guanine(966)-N(2))-methyltransferase RsmD [Clostridiales bacterium]|jgi:16S rRNA (guanine(966)-N(2))-methyltransferase RsmD|nr:16S rRNA (guanine(966)-N(2))-methyltransferase RsmD [Clostridiales bacterium]